MTSDKVFLPISDSGSALTARKFGNRNPLHSAADPSALEVAHADADLIQAGRQPGMKFVDSPAALRRGQVFGDWKYFQASHKAGQWLALIVVKNSAHIQIRHAHSVIEIKRQGLAIY